MTDFEKNRTTINIMNETVKLYSQRAIALATYLGGPIAAGIMIRRNSINLGKERQGLNALFIGIISTILIFIGIFQIPDDIIDKIPNALIPLVYTLVIYLIVEKIHGKELKKHKEENGRYFSIWKAAGIGLVCLVIIAGVIFLFAYYQAVDWDAERYDAGLEQFNKNELEAMQLFEMLDKESKYEIVNFIRNTGIPKWKASIDIINELNRIENLPPEFERQNMLLLEYCELRIEAYDLISNAILNETNEYDLQIIQRHERIDEIINELE